VEVAIRVGSHNNVDFVRICSVHLLAVDVVLVFGVLHHCLGLVTADVVLTFCFSKKSGLAIEGILLDCRLLLFVEPSI